MSERSLPNDAKHADLVTGPAEDGAENSRNQTASSRPVTNPNAPILRTRIGSRKVTAACLACRRRKTRCSGPPPPCEACYQHGSECKIDPDSDRRRKVPKAVIADLDVHGPALTRLVDALREPGDASDRLLRTIRGGAPLAQILAVVEENKREREIQAATVKESSPLSELEIDPPQVHETALHSEHPSLSFFDLGASSSTAIPVASPATEQPVTEQDQNPGIQGLGYSTLTELLSLVRDLNGIEHTARILRQDRRGWHPSLQPHRGDTLGAEEDSATSSFTLDSREQQSRREIAPKTTDRSTWYATPGYVNVFGNLPLSSAVKTNGYPDSIQGLQLANFNMPEYQIQPLNWQDDSLLSNLSITFRTAATKMIADGVPIAQVFGPENPNMDLLLRDRRPEDAFSVSNWAAEVCRQFPAFELPELLRGAYVFCLYMRWLILPTPENYAALPVDYRPTPLQRFVPHAPLIDLQTPAVLRDALCIDFRDFMTPQEVSISINWAYATEDALEIDSETGFTQLTQAFRDHILDTDNLTFSSLMLDYFPELKGHLNIKERLPPVPAF